MDREMTQDANLIPNTDANRIDYIVTTLKGIVGPVPLIGPIIAELIGTLIPQQRIDRIARYVRILEQKIAKLDREQVKARFATPGFIDLLEDSLHQAIRALTEERLQHIAAIVKNGLTDEQAEYDQYKYLLALFAEMNDTEMIILQSYLDDEMTGELSEFFLMHQELLMAEGAAHMGSSEDVIERATVHQAYRQHISRLSLLRSNFQRPRRNELPEFDQNTGMMKASGYELTPLGRLFLNRMDLTKSEPK